MRADRRSANAGRNSLHVRNVPPQLYEVIRRRALEGKRSISAESILLLERALGLDRPATRELLDSIRSARPRVRGAIDAAALIREDRDRQ